jgi:hypothetical protein
MALHHPFLATTASHARTFTFSSSNRTIADVYASGQALKRVMERLLADYCHASSSLCSLTWALDHGELLMGALYDSHIGSNG